MCVLLWAERRLCPTARQPSITCAGVFGGVAVYTFHDIDFTVLGYVWLGIWYSFAVFEMVYVKKVVDTVDMTTWSRTYYQASHKSIRLFSPDESNQGRAVEIGPCTSAQGCMS